MDSSIPQQSIVTLTTDFGWSSPYVAEMKGVLHNVTPKVQSIDITHSIARHDIAAAAHIVRDTCPLFPNGTVHLVVVDPEVGSDRPIVAGQVDSQFVVGPDNGVFNLLTQMGRRTHYVRLDQPKWWRPNASHTFQGRDIMAPVAAYLANGVALAEFGRPTRLTAELSIDQPERHDDCIRGHIAAIDTFGNVITNITRSQIESLVAPPDHPIVTASQSEWSVIRSHYAEVHLGESLCLFSSHDYLEIAINQGHAARELGLACGQSITVRRSP